MNTPHHIPRDVQSQINATKAMIEQHILDEAEVEQTVDQHYDRIVETLMQVSDRLQEEAAISDRYIFNQAEFVAALDHVVADQLSALKKEKISPAQWAERFNRWFVFCDAVCNLGISCMYTQAALKNTDYETVFKTLKLNKTFEAAFLKPRKIRVELTHKSKEVKEKYPWLAMPCLIVKDEEGVEHQIAITPSPNARVWWLDVLAGFHGSYSWIQADAEDEEFASEDDLPTSIGEPYPVRETAEAVAEPVITEAKRPAAPVVPAQKTPMALIAEKHEVAQPVTTWQPKSVFFQTVLKVWNKLVLLFR